MLAWTCLGTSACLELRDSLSRWDNCFMDSASSVLEGSLELVEGWGGPAPLPPLPPQGEGDGEPLVAGCLTLGGGTGTAM